MSDSDVQDVRDMVAKQKADAQAQQKVVQKMKRLAELDNADVQMLLQMRDAGDARKDKEVRLGIQPGRSAAGKCYS
jgi:hypothetical protein